MSTVNLLFNATQCFSYPWRQGLVTGIPPAEIGCQNQAYHLSCALIRVLMGSQYSKYRKGRKLAGPNVIEIVSVREIYVCRHVCCLNRETTL